MKALTIEEMAGDRNATIAELKRALKHRSGKAWSVTGGRGTAWGWIRIDAPPARRTSQYGYMTDEDRAELASLLGLDAAHFQGVNIPASTAYRREYLQRAMGMTVTVNAEPYWD